MPDDTLTPMPDDTKPVAGVVDIYLEPRSLTVDEDEIVKLVRESVRQAQDERTDWMDKRTLRYAKLYGWVESRQWEPWEDASNQWVPVMIGNSLRMKAGLFNAVMGIRPVMDAKPGRKDLKEAADRVAQVIDHQVFIESNGDQAIERFIEQYVDDGTVIAYVPWVRDRRAIVDVHYVPVDPLQEPPQTLDELVPSALESLLPSLTKLEKLDISGRHWKGTAPAPDVMQRDIEYDIRVRREERFLELKLSHTALTFDGPTIIVQNLEDTVVPMRAENCQPPSPHNPGGAPWIARMLRVHKDDILRRVQNGDWDLLSQEDAEAIKGSNRIPQEGMAARKDDAIRELRDTQAGLQSNLTTKPEANDEWVTLIEWYGQRDVDEDGLAEDVIFSVLEEDGKLVRARNLTEQYPVPEGQVILRPFAEARYVPVPGQFYGISLPELMEGVHDWIHTMINQAIDNGQLANMPFGFYRPSSGLKPETYRPRPFELFPTDNPQQDVYFPQIPHSDQSFFTNMTQLAMQFMDRETQIGPIQMGQVPQGKASALRTTGTTMTLLQQGAAMPEQLLRRLFLGLTEVWQLIHRLNRRYLPAKKNFLIAGKPLDQDDAYGMIQSRQEIDFPVQFAFQATLLNTNKGMMGQAITGLGAALVNPMMMQMGIVTPEQIYNWAKDLIQANQLDPSRYLKKPAGVPEGPRTTAEEAILMIFEGRLPVVAPLEDPQEHLQKLQEFMQSEQFGYLDASCVLLFKHYLLQVAQLVQQQMQQQQLMQAAQQFSQNLQQQGQGQQGALPAALAPQSQLPGLQAESATPAEIQGAGTQGPPGSRA